MMLIATFLVTLGLTAAQDPDARTQAERLARAGSHEEALARFQALAAANPDDTAARLWIARLHLLMGHPRRAAAVFESLVATDSKNVEALTGLGLALLEAGDRRAAAEALDRAESLAPERVDVLAAQGRLHGADNRATLGLAYYNRALVMDPSNASLRAESDALRASRAHRVELGYDFQSFDPDGGRLHAGRVEVNVRVADAVRVFARGQVLSHDGSAVALQDLALREELLALGLNPAFGAGGGEETRGGAGIEWAISPSIAMRAGAQFASNTFWLPEVDAFANATFGVGRLQWSLRAHYVDFDAADMWIAGPGFTYDLTPRTALVAEYLRGRTGAPGGDSATTDSGTLGIHTRLGTRSSGFIEYHRGLDRLDWFTLDRLGAADANTVSLGASTDLTPFVGLGARYDYQERSGDAKVHRANAHFTFRF